MNMDNMRELYRLAILDYPAPDEIWALAEAVPADKANPIREFQGAYRFLSNFYDSGICYDDITYKNNEAAFQAQKTLDPERRKNYAGMAPNEAKRAGRRENLRPDWEDVKITEMFRIVYLKFHQNEVLARWLLDTGDRYLIEGNTWNDMFWGICRGAGKNWLGIILMAVRNRLRYELALKKA